VPDNTLKIAKIDAALESGVSSTATDGTSVSIDRESLRAERRRLVAEDDVLKNQRPTVCGFNLGNP
jgi:hypothetical protein